MPHCCNDRANLAMARLVMSPSRNAGPSVRCRPCSPPGLLLSIAVTVMSLQQSLQQHRCHNDAPPKIRVRGGTSARWTERAWLADGAAQQPDPSAGSLKSLCRQTRISLPTDAMYRVSARDWHSSRTGWHATSEGTHTMIGAGGLTKIYRGSDVIGTRGEAKCPPPSSLSARLRRCSTSAKQSLADLGSHTGRG